jgi:hypothetical protein
LVGDTEIATLTPSCRTVRDRTKVNVMKRDAMRQAAETFWNGQEQILHAMEEYATGWFERRHVGVDAALNASQQMIDGATPVEAVREYQKWAFRSVERIIDDGLSCQKHLLSMGGLLAPPLSPFGERTETESASEEPRRRSQSRVTA